MNRLEAVGFIVFARPLPKNRWIEKQATGRIFTPVHNSHGISTTTIQFPYSSFNCFLSKAIRKHSISGLDSKLLIAIGVCY